MISLATRRTGICNLLRLPECLFTTRSSSQPVEPCYRRRLQLRSHDCFGLRWLKRRKILASLLGLSCEGEVQSLQCRMRRPRSHHPPIRASPTSRAVEGGRTTGRSLHRSLDSPTRCKLYLYHQRVPRSRGRLPPWVFPSRPSYPTPSWLPCSVSP